MPAGVFRPYTLTDVLAGMAAQNGQQQVDTTTSGVGFFAEADETVATSQVPARDQTATPTQINGKSGTITWGTNPAVGAKVLVVVAAQTTVAPTSVVDNGVTPRTFTLDAIGVGTANNVFIYRADAITLPAAGSYQVTVTWAASHLQTIMGQSYTNVAVGGPGTAVSANANTNTAVSTGATAPMADGSLFFAAFQDNSALNPETISAPGGGFTAVTTETNGSAGRPGGCADLVGTGVASQTCTWTLGDSVAWNAALVAYPPLALAAPFDTATTTVQLPTGWDGGEWNQFAWEAELNLLATTGLSGFALQNGTPTILSWTAPNDGQMHRVLVAMIGKVTTAETGGIINATGQDPGGNGFTSQLDGGAHGGGATIVGSVRFFPVAPGTTFSIVQGSALTAGAATVWMELWGQ